MKVQCPHCDARLKVPDEALGRTGRCPKCQQPVLLVPADASGQGQGMSTVSAEVAHAAGPAPAPVPLAGDRSRAGRLAAGDGAPVVQPLAGDDDGYGLIDPEPASLTPPGAVVNPSRSLDPRTKSKRERQLELEDIRSEGNRFLWKIRILYLTLGLLMILFNGYTFGTIDESVAGFKSAALAAKIDPAKVDGIARSLGIALRVECGLYFALGLGLCAMAALFRRAPKVAAIIALATYVAVWFIDLLMIQAIFGDIALGQSIFSFATVMKIAVISGLWYGVQVGGAYQEQVVDPERALAREEMED